MSFQERFRELLVREAPNVLVTRQELVILLRRLNDEVNTVDFNFQRVDHVPRSLNSNVIKARLADYYGITPIKTPAEIEETAFDWRTNPRYKTALFLEGLVLLVDSDTPLKEVASFIVERSQVDELDYIDFLDVKGFEDLLAEVYFLETLESRSSVAIFIRVIRGKIKALVEKK